MTSDRDRLIELLDKVRGIYFFAGDDNLNLLADHLLASGAILLPCKVGDTVYTNYNHLLKKNTDEIFECKVVFIGFYENGNYINLVDNYEHLHSMDFETFSKTVFLTKEEAEKALVTDKNVGSKKEREGK